MALLGVQAARGGGSPGGMRPPSPDVEGLYLGAHLGGLWADHDAKVVADSSEVGAPLQAGVIPFDIDASGRSVMGGGQLGYNWNRGAALLGIEGDLSATGDVDSTAVATNVGGGFLPVTTSLSSDMSWLATVRARIGVLAAPNLLLYATGGAAFAKVDHVMRLQATPLTAGNLYGARDATQAGWTVGGGGEWWMSRDWSLKAEYLYFDLGKTSVTLRDPAQFPNVYLVYDVETTGQIGRVGLNYRFAHPAWD